MNVYTDLTLRLETTLSEELALLSWDPLVVRHGIWKPRELKPFERYLVFVAPPTTNPWTEERFRQEQEM